MLTANGVIVLLAGFLEEKYGDKSKAWSYTMLVVALIMIFITVYNFFMTPDPEIEQEYIKSNANHKGSFAEVFTTFFQKKQIGLILTFILVYRLGESQLIKMLTPFLIDNVKKGGMGLSTEDVGIIYGTFGVAALVIGGIIGGIVISRDGLGKWMLPMILAMHLPIIGFVYLSHYHPSAIVNFHFEFLKLVFDYNLNSHITAVVIIEQFGYGFGFAAFMMYLIYVVEGESKTSHYSIITGFMALGMMLPGMASGYIQDYLGYGNFFIWVFCATIPGVIISRFLEFPADFGKKSESNILKK
jgi:PAT family beta-lactamase induction signal transducer AmpG